MILLQLDYQRKMKPFPWAGVILLALALMTAALAAFHYHELVVNTAYWEAKAGLAERYSPHVTGSVRDASDMAAEIKHANEVLSKITLPWDGLFQAVEWSSGKDVALLGIEPNAEKHEVRINGEAKNISSVMKYMRHLSAQEIFSAVYLQSHRVQEQNPEKPVRFAVVASWKVAP